MSKSTYWIVEAENIKILGHGNIFYKFKKNIIKRIDNRLSIFEIKEHNINVDPFPKLVYKL